MKKKEYEKPAIEMFLFSGNISIMASSNKCAYSYYNRSQANVIRSQFANIYSSITQKQKKALMAMISSFAMETGSNNHDVLKLFEFYIISIGFSEEDLIRSAQGSRDFNTYEDILAVLKTISDRTVLDLMILTASGLVKKANTNRAWNLMGYVCDTLGYDEERLDDLFLKNEALMKMTFS